MVGHGLAQLVVPVAAAVAGELEGALPDPRERGGQRHGRAGGAALESRLAHRLHRRGQRKLGQGTAVVEGVAADRPQRGGEGDRGQGAAVLEGARPGGVGAHPLDSLRQAHRPQSRAPGEHGVGHRHEGARELHGGQGGAALEDAVGAVPVAIAVVLVVHPRRDALGQGHAGERGAAGEGVGAQVGPGRHVHGGELGAAPEGRRADLAQPRRQRDRAHPGGVLEGRGADGGDGLAVHLGGDDEIGVGVFGHVVDEVVAGPGFHGQGHSFRALHQRPLHA